MTDLVVFGASCVVVGLAAGVLIGLWTPPPRRREALPTLVVVHDVTPQPRHLHFVEAPTVSVNGQFIDAEALGWLEGA